MQLISFIEVVELESTEKYKILLLNKMDCHDYLKTKFTIFFQKHFSFVISLKFKSLLVC